MKPPRQIKSQTTVIPDGHGVFVPRKLNVPKFGEKLVETPKFNPVVRHIENWSTFGKFVR